MEPARKFKIIVNSKECGTCSGSTPSAVAKKVVKKLCGKSNKVVKFSLKECKRGCERVCGPYQGRMEKLDKPCKRNGKMITHRVVCEKVRKMRGGRDLKLDDFKVDDGEFKFERIGLRPHIFFGEKINVNGKQYHSLVVFNIELTGESKTCGFNQLKIENQSNTSVVTITENEIIINNEQYLLSLLKHLLYCKKLTDYKTIRRTIYELLKNKSSDNMSLDKKLNIPEDLFKRNYLPEVMTADVICISSDFYMKLPKDENKFKKPESDDKINEYGAELNSENTKSVFKKPNFLKKVGYVSHIEKENYIFFSNKKDSEYYYLAIFSISDTYIGIYNPNKKIVKFYPIDIKHFSRLMYPSNFIELVSILFPFKYRGNCINTALKLLYFYQKYISTKIKMKGTRYPYENTQKFINSFEKKAYYINPILQNYIYENPELTTNDINRLDSAEIFSIFPKSNDTNDIDEDEIKEKLKQLINKDSVLTTYLNTKTEIIDINLLNMNDVQDLIYKLKEIGYTYDKEGIKKELKIKQKKKLEELEKLEKLERIKPKIRNDIEKYLNKNPKLTTYYIDGLENIEIHDIFPEENENKSNKRARFLKNTPYYRKLLKQQIFEKEFFTKVLSRLWLSQNSDIDKMFSNKSMEKEINSLLEELKQSKFYQHKTKSIDEQKQYVKNTLKDLIQKKNKLRKNKKKYYSNMIDDHYKNRRLINVNYLGLTKEQATNIFPESIRESVTNEDIYYIMKLLEKKIIMLKKMNEFEGIKPNIRQYMINHNLSMNDIDNLSTEEIVNIILPLLNFDSKKISSLHNKEYYVKRLIKIIKELKIKNLLKQILINNKNQQQQQQQQQRNNNTQQERNNNNGNNAKRTATTTTQQQQQQQHKNNGNNNAEAVTAKNNGNNNPAATTTNNGNNK
jgi:hypothetical protein